MIQASTTDALRTAAGLLKFRPVRPGSRVALVAPASPFKREEFDDGLRELREIGLEPVFEERVFERLGFVAGTAASRAAELARAWRRPDIDAIIAVRGGYGSMELLPMLDLQEILASRTAFVGYSDVTSVHVALNCHAGMTSVHGPMIEGRIASGPSAYDRTTFFKSLSTEPIGEIEPAGLDVVLSGEARGPLFGGTLTQLLASLGTAFEFRPPAGHILFVDDIGERPYRLHRMLTQWRLAGRLASAAAVVFGELPRCDDPGGGPTVRSVIAEVFSDFTGPVLIGFPSGHVTTPLLSLPFGVSARVVTGARPKLVIEEAAAAP